MVYKLAKCPFNLTWNLVCFYFSYCDSLKNCASQFSENCVQTVNDNNSEAQSKFQKVWNIYAFNKDNTLQLLSLEKGNWGRWQKIPYFWVVIEVRGNSKTKGLERGRKRRARLRCSHASRVWHSHAAAALIFRAFKKTILRKKKTTVLFSMAEMNQMNDSLRCYSLRRKRKCFYIRKFWKLDELYLP